MNSRYHPTGTTKRSQHGFSIVSAIFLLVVLSGLGAAMLAFSNAQHTSSAQDMQGTRAYQAARGGLEWGIFKLMNPPAPCFASPTSFVPPAPTLSSFTVTVTCESFTASGVTVYRIQSTACNQPGAGGACPGTPGGISYIERQLQVTL
jgi:MSHA biogenesis protein MshP